MSADPEQAVAYGIFTVQQALHAGHSRSDIASRVRRGHWVRTSRGILEAVDRSPHPEDWAARLLLPAGRGAVLAFEAAARLFGWDVPRTGLPAVIRPEHSSAGRPGFRTRLNPGEVLMLGVLAVTTPVRTALDLATSLPVTEAVVAVDCGLRRGQFGMTDLMAQGSAPRRHVVRARRVLALVDPLSGSVPESRARVLFHEAGLPPPRTQLQVRIGGRLYRPDFAWPQKLVAVEIDGRTYHIDAVAFQNDRTRQNAFVQAGWLILRFTVEDVLHRPEYVVTEVRRALAGR